MMTTNMTNARGNLTQREALSLLPALALHVAEQCGTRLLLVKGDSYTHHGLRNERVHADIDVLLSPDDVTPFLAAMTDLGWHSRYGEYDDYPLPSHSKTLIHERWPIDIDVHRRFPGFLRDPRQVFEELWDTRSEVTLAGRRVPVTGLAASALVLALHSVRSKLDDPRYAPELERLCEAARGWDTKTRDDVRDLAIRTGCSQSLAQVLPRLGVEANLPDGADPIDLQRWASNLERGFPSPSLWFRNFRGSPLHSWPRMLWDTIWPNEAYLRGTRQIRPGKAALNRARRERIFRGSRNLLAVVIRNQPRTQVEGYRPGRR